MNAPTAEAAWDALWTDLVNLYGVEPHYRPLIESTVAARAPLDLDALALTLERLELDCDPQANIIHSTCDHDEQALGFAREYERHRAAVR